MLITSILLIVLTYLIFLITLNILKQKNKSNNKTKIAFFHPFWYLYNIYISQQRRRRRLKSPMVHIIININLKITFINNITSYLQFITKQTIYNIKNKSTNKL